MTLFRSCSIGTTHQFTNEEDPDVYCYSISRSTRIRRRAAHRALATTSSVAARHPATAHLLGSRASEECPDADQPLLGPLHQADPALALRHDRHDVPLRMADDELRPVPPRGLSTLRLPARCRRRWR